MKKYILFSMAIALATFASGQTRDEAMKGVKAVRTVLVSFPPFSSGNGYQDQLIKEANAHLQKAGIEIDTASNDWLWAFIETTQVDHNVDISIKLTFHRYVKPRKAGEPSSSDETWSTFATSRGQTDTLEADLSKRICELLDVWVHDYEQQNPKEPPKP